MLLQMTKFHSFLWLSSTPLYICTTSSLSIHLLTGTWVTSIILAIVNNAAMNIGCIYLFKLVFSFSLDIYLGVELLDHMVVLFLVF